MKLDARNVRVLAVNGNPKSLLELGYNALDEIRSPLLKPLRTSFRAPNQIALYLFRDGSWVVENFNDEPADVELDGTSFKIPGRGWRYDWK